jgi:hypothetical protein
LSAPYLKVDSFGSRALFFKPFQITYIKFPYMVNPKTKFSATQKIELFWQRPLRHQEKYFCVDIVALRVIKLNMVQNKRQVLTKCSKGPEKFLKDPRSN